MRGDQMEKKWKEAFFTVFSGFFLAVNKLWARGVKADKVDWRKRQHARATSNRIKTNKREYF